MPRKGPAKVRVHLSDPIYGDVLVTRFINRLMLDGKKSIAEKIFYTAMESCEARSKQPAIEVFRRALNNTMPVVEVRPRRVGGSTYQVPVQVREERRVARSFRWIIINARKRSGRSMAEKLAGELLDAANNTGPSVKNKEDVHRMADANKAFAHYRW
ncbi:MAG: 30S ribosomal protein S7 [Chthonomonadaceae bacterium]|nr:30S ribosomal protein S7 [Chthonomonadaceae bacterium]